MSIKRSIPQAWVRTWGSTCQGFDGPIISGDIGPLDCHALNIFLILVAYNNDQWVDHKYALNSIIRSKFISPRISFSSTWCNGAWCHNYFLKPLFECLTACVDGTWSNIPDGFWSRIWRRLHQTSLTHGRRFHGSSSYKSASRRGG